MTNTPLDDRRVERKEWQQVPTGPEGKGDVEVKQKAERQQAEDDKKSEQEKTFVIDVEEGWMMP